MCRVQIVQPRKRIIPVAELIANSEGSMNTALCEAVEHRRGHGLHHAQTAIMGTYEILSGPPHGRSGGAAQGATGALHRAEAGSRTGE
jgi:hypothetical protein